MNGPESKPNFNLSLVDLKALEKPAIKLIETVRNAVGILYEPRRIVERAKAEAEARIIEAEGEIIAEGVAERTRRRIAWQESHRQENIENVTQLALKYLPASVEPTPVDPDWVSRFFECCADVSNEEMQSLWATLLAGEVSKPGTYSPRTLSVVRDMRHRDAHAFTKFATFLWRGETDGSPVEWFALLRTFQNNFQLVNLPFEDLIQLEALGLIRQDYMQGFWITLKSPHLVTYFSHQYRISHSDTTQTPLNLDAGECILTQAGQELAPIAGATQNLDYLERILTLLKSQGLVVEAVPPK